MIHLFRFLCLVHCVQYVTSQITMVESGPGTVKPTETLELTCKVTGASLTDKNNLDGVHWIWQSERKQLAWLGVIWYDASTVYASSVQGRLTLTRDTNKGEVYCKFTGIKPEESGTYYCARNPHTVYEMD
uniref:Ig-like domain-containing protein n=1 Tax=Pyxicephalus adspersus TaxID=30357 RepID=A0AAV3A790_PYXAD|nr:TPA: hypothetical protein GDO54_013547 [Pyxicephalus adspersus]